jgi:hypothetical protein
VAVAKERIFEVKGKNPLFPLLKKMSLFLDKIATELIHD